VDSVMPSQKQYKSFGPQDCDHQERGPKQS